MTARDRIDPNRWERIKKVFHAARDAEPARRDDILTEHCGDDKVLRREIEELLNAGDGAERYLGAMARRAGLPFRDALPTPTLAGRRFGAYRLLRLLGQGGMGVVYLAERDDQQFEKQVAIKLLPVGLDSDAARERLLAERRILASLEHPGITRLLDAGIAEDGTPFFVMEYVEGEPIDRYCSIGTVGLDGRIRLFLQVCDAVDHAHRALVVHRDLKPGNVLVTAEGEVKLLDFGVSKVLDGEAPGDAALTQRAGRPMTPAYASPEQIRGERVTTATDVYALGVLLYELLVGRPPYAVSGLSATDLERLVCTVEPPPPSTALHHSGQREGGTAAAAAAANRGTSSTTTTASAGVIRPRSLRGDLDTIVLKALRKEPDQRYRSVAALAEDLVRHQEGRPVMARPPRLAYRAGKLMRRRPGLIAAAAAGVLVTAGFAATLVVHADRVDTERAVAEAERDRARIAAASAEQVRDFLVEAFELADPAQTQGLGATARDILDAGAERALVAQSADPLVQADMLTAIAEVYLRLNVNSGARPLAQASLALREEHAEPLSPGVLENRWQLLRGTTDWGERARHYPELVELGRELYGSEHPRFAALLGDHARAMPDRAASEATFDTAISILRRHPGDVRTQLATTLLQSTYNRGAPPYALDRALEALELRRAVHGNEHPTVARSLSDLALFHERTDPVAADTLMREAVAIHRRTAGESHTTTLTLMNNWAGILRDQGRFAEAEPAYREVLRLRRAHQPDEPAPAALSEAGLGIVLLETDRAAEAKPLLRSAVATYPVSGGRGRASRGHLARALVELGEFEEAEALLHELLESSRERASDADERETLERLAGLYRSWGQGELSPLDRDRLVALRVAATER